MRPPRGYQTPPEFTPLVNCLKRVPTLNGPGFGSNNDIPGGYFPDGRWWVTFQFKIDDEMVWPVIRRLAEIFNNTSSPVAADAFPIVFRPVVPEGPPSIWWILESTRAGFAITEVVERMKTRLPQPFEDESRWT